MGENVKKQPKGNLIDELSNNVKSSGIELDKENDLIEYFFEKEKVFLTKIGFTLDDPQNFLKDQIISKVQELSSFLERQLSNPNGEPNEKSIKWGNLYVALGKKDLYMALADFSSNYFSRTSLLRSFGKQGKNFTEEDKQELYTEKKYLNELRVLTESYKAAFTEIGTQINEVLKVSESVSSFTNRKHIIDYYSSMVSQIVNKDNEEYIESILSVYKKVLENIGENSQGIRKKREKCLNQIQNELKKQKDHIIFYSFTIDNDTNEISANSFLKIAITSVSKNNSNNSKQTEGLSNLKNQFKKNASEEKYIENIKEKYCKEFCQLIYKKLSEDKDTKNIENNDKYPPLTDFENFIRTIITRNIKKNNSNSIFQVKDNDNETVTNIQTLIQYNNQGVSGLLGEIRGAIMATYGFNIGDIKILGSELSTSGQRAVDIGSEDNDFGLQIKNYIFSTNNISLYETAISLNENKFLNRYLNKDFVDKLQTLLKETYVNTNNGDIIATSSGLLKQHLLFNISNFLRISQQDIQDNIYNLFFLINDLYYPASYILRLFDIEYSQNNDKKIIQDPFLINNNNLLFFKQKGDTNENILSKNIIYFKGVTIPISKLTR